MSDVTFELGDRVINLRVGAIVTCADEVLLCRLPKDDWWFTPGGRIQAGESSHAAILRELTEELGGGFEIKTPLICSENFFTLRGRQFHEVCMYYSVIWNGPPGARLSESGEIREWFPISRLSSVALKPTFLTRYAGKALPGMVHVIHRDGGEGSGSP